MLVGLYHQRLPRALRDAAMRAFSLPLHGLRTVHSGLVGDHITLDRRGHGH